MIYIVDYQSGNLGAIVNMMKKVGAKAEIATNPDQLLKATKIILPGVGTFDTGMKNLMEGGWMQILNQKVLTEKTITMGICLGMQLITESSEEGKLKGLGWVAGTTKKFVFENNKDFKVPHMGWNKVRVSKKSKLLTAARDEEKRFYFAHAYYVTVANPEDELLSTSYGVPFTSAIEKGNILGVQFHPEKSHRFGMELLKNFVNNY